MIKYTHEEALAASLKYFNGDELAANVWIEKYALRNKEDILLEKSPEDMHRRMAKEFARIEKKKFKNPLTEKEIFDTFDKFKYIVPQGSPMSGIGNKYQKQTLGNCYVIDNVIDSIGGICYTDQVMAQLMKRRAGVGTDISNIRPAGLHVENAARTTDGFGVFADKFSETVRGIAQGGRRGALLISMSVHHPEIEQFIKIKRDKKRVTGANISVRFTDAFLTAVENNTEYEQYWPMTGPKQISKMVNAKQIWNMMMDTNYNDGEPGCMFWDTMINNSLSNRYGSIDDNFYDRTTNPCFAGSEYLLTDTGYKKFGELYKTKEANVVICDNRISYIDEGVEKPENWKIDTTKGGIVPRLASNVFLTKKNAELVRVETDIGMDVICTPDHHFATTEGMVEAKDLLSRPDQPPKEILITVPTNAFNINSIVGKLPETIDEIDAFLMGMVAGDGCFGGKNTNIINIDFWGKDKDRMSDICTKFIDILYETNKDYIIEDLKNGWDKRKLSPYYISHITKSNKIRIGSTWLAYYLNKKYNFNKNTKLVVPELIMNNSSTTIGKFYLASFMYCDGTINISNKKSCCSVRISQSDVPILKQIQLMLHSNGILFKFYQRRKAHLKKIKGNVYNIKPQYELISICGSYYHYSKEIGVLNSDKEIKLNDYIYNHNTHIQNSYSTSVKRVVELNETQDVYCIKEDVGRNIIVNGCSVRRCGEIVMGIDSCRLTIINLMGFVEDAYTDKAFFNYEKFDKYVQIGQRLMDDIIDLELECLDDIIEKIQSDKEPQKIKQIELDSWLTIKDSCIKGRRTGFGITALADVFGAMGYKYGSPESLQTTDNIFKHLAVNSMKSSCLMAKELGAFPLYNKDLEYTNIAPILKRIFDASPEVAELHKKYGRRNISLTTCSPTGSVSLLTQTSSGVEPVFELSYKRRKKINATNSAVKVDFTDDVGDKWQEFTMYHQGLANWLKVNPNKDIKKSPYYGSTVKDIDLEASIDLQSTVQKWITHSVSKTVNAPKNVTLDMVEKLYMRAWKGGCKGMTFYRDGSRSGVLISEDTPTTKDAIKKTNAPKRPKELPCEIHHIKVTKKLDKIRSFEYMVMLGLLNDSVYECFAIENGKYDKKLTKGKIIKESTGNYHLIFEDGTEIKNITKNTTEEEDMLTRMTSISLRHGVPIQYIVDQLLKTEGDMFSFGKSIARALKKYIKDGTLTSDTCPECKAKLIFKDGCKSCTCGWTKCG